MQVGESGQEGGGGWERRAARIFTLAAVCATAAGQVCTTQAKLGAVQRDSLVASAITLGAAIQAADIAKVRASTVPEYASDFAASEYLIRNTASKLSGDTLTVSSVYGLDASSRSINATDSADFTCLLAGSALETDFSIPGLPPGKYAFAMVEADGGARPWLLSFLLRQDGATWKMAGFYPHARSVGGHDGLWFWNTARDQVKAKHPWTAWLQYGQADVLLRPANFVTSTHLDKLRMEQHNAAPPEVANGVMADAPLVLTESKGGEFHFTSVTTEASEDGKRINIMLHLRVESSVDGAVARGRNLSAASAFVDAHPDLRKAFDGVWVFAETPTRPPFATQHTMQEIP